MTERPDAPPWQRDGGIFVSYRRTDRGHTRALWNELRTRFPGTPVFLDVDAIPPGMDFGSYIDRAISGSRVVLVVVGPQWVRSGPSAGADGPNDWVHVEIEAAVRHGVPLVPVLLEDTPMPRAAELPPPVAVVTRLQAVRLRHESWDADVARLTTWLGDLVRPTGPRTYPSPGHPQRPPATPRQPAAGFRPAGGSPPAAGSQPVGGRRTAEEPAAGSAGWTGGSAFGCGVAAVIALLVVGLLGAGGYFAWTKTRETTRSKVGSWTAVESASTLRVSIERVERRGGEVKLAFVIENRGGADFAFSRFAEFVASDDLDRKYGVNPFVSDDWNVKILPKETARVVIALDPDVPARATRLPQIRLEQQDFPGTPLPGQTFTIRNVPLP